jgi:hypothetical protein
MRPVIGDDGLTLNVADYTTDGFTGSKTRQALLVIALAALPTAPAV